MSTKYEFGIRLAVDGEQQVVAATDKAGKGFKDMGADAERGSRLASDLIGKLGALAGAYVGMNTVTTFVQTADAMNAMDGRLRNVIKSSGDYQIAQADIYRISQQNNVGLKDTATLYTRLYDPVAKLGGGVREVTLMTDALSTGLRINNATQAESSSAIMQFSQAMASGVLRGEEYNAVNEAAPGFMRALAESLGVGQGELRKMAEEGKLTADVVGNAMPGAMKILETQAAGLPETIGGAFSDLKNDASLLAQQIDQTTGATSGLTEMVSAGAGLVREFSAVMRDNAGSTALAGQGFDTVGAAIRVVGTIAETVLLVISDVSFMLRGIGREAGGLAAQITAVATGNFAEAKRIGDEMRADAVLARAELTKYQTSVAGMTDKVLQGRDALRNHSLSAAENSTEMARLAGNSNNTAGGYTRLAAATNGSKEADKAKAAALKALAEEEKRQTGTLLELAGLSKDYGEKVKDLNAMLGAGKISHETYYGAMDKLQAKTPASIQQTKDLAAAQKLANDEFDRAFDAMEKERLQVEKRVGAAAGYLTKIQQETGDLKLSRGELALVTAERELERLGVVKGTEAYEAYITKIKAAVVDKENTTAAIGEMKRIEDAAKATANNIEQGLIDSLFRAFESGKGFFSTLWSGVKNTFKTEILTPIIKDVLSPFAQAWRSIASQISNTVLTPMISAVTSGLGLGSYTGSAQAGGGGGSLVSTASTIGSFFPAVGGMISSGASAVTGFLTSVGVGASSATGAGSLAINAALAESAVVGGTAAAGSLGSMLATAGPYALAALAAIVIANKLFGSKGGPKVEGMANTGGFAGIPTGGSADGEAATILGNLQTLYTGSATALGGQAGTLTGASFLARDPNGTAMTQLVLDAAINGKEVFSRNNRTSGGNVEDVGRDPQAFADAVAEAQTRALLASLKATTFADPDIAAMIAAISTTATVSEINGQIQAAIQAKANKDAAAAAANPAPAGSAGSGVGSGADYFTGVSSVQATSMVDSLASIDTKLDAMQKLVDGQTEQSNDQRTGQTAMASAINGLLQVLDNLTEGGNQLRVIDPTAQPVLTNALVELIALREKLFSVIDSSNRVMTIETP